MKCIRLSGLAVVILALLLGCRYSDSGDVADTPTADARVPGTSRLAGLLGGNGEQGFPKAYEPIKFSFPFDHGPHPEYRNEWWYLTGNLDSETGRRFGFELTLFRFSLSAEAPITDSAWRTNQIYIGHFAVTDVAEERFFVAERYSRGAVGLAGAERSPLRIWLEDWQLEAPGSNGEHDMPWILSASTEEAELRLSLVAEKSPILNGEQGLSQKSAEPGNASYYYSMPRLAAEGRLRIESESHAVAGLAWLDREWSSSALSANQVGWDWFALQFDDRSELMFYQLRNLDGSVNSYSSGTFIKADGSAIGLTADDVELVATDYWFNVSGDRYPIAWSLNVPSQNIELQVRPVIQDQELDTTVRYWEGAVDVSGRRNEASIKGRGYVELTGYSQ